MAREKGLRPCLEELQYLLCHVEFHTQRLSPLIKKFLGSLKSLLIRTTKVFHSFIILTHYPFAHNPAIFFQILPLSILST